MTGVSQGLAGVGGRVAEMFRGKKSREGRSGRLLEVPEVAHITPLSF